MRPSRQLPLTGLLFLSLIPRQPCQICEVNETNLWRLEPLINTMLKANYTKGIQGANVLLTLRLAGIKNHSLEQQLSQQIKEDINSTEMELTSGQLALGILALGACENPDEAFIRDAHLVSKLGDKFQAEIQNMETNRGSPLTNYYQLSLALLALCLFNGNYPITSVTYYFNPENKNYYFHGQFSVDTGAMAVLALTCVQRNIQKKMDANTEDEIKNYIASLANKIQSEGKQGLFGNTFSTGEAMQTENLFLSLVTDQLSSKGSIQEEMRKSIWGKKDFTKSLALFVSSDYYKNETNCQETLHTAFHNVSRGAFYLPIAAAQILPALLGKTYLDVTNSSSCGHRPVKFNISTDKPDSVTPTTAPLNILVKYSVRINKTSYTEVTVRKGSVFLDVMKAAQEKNETLFRFTVEETSWGPYVTSVQGIRANSNDRTYWELLSNGQPLSQGAGSYVVQNGDNLEVRWSKY